MSREKINWLVYEWVGSVEALNEDYYNVNKESELDWIMTHADVLGRCMRGDTPIRRVLRELQKGHNR